jgi:hypothetical protein
MKKTLARSEPSAFSAAHRPITKIRPSRAAFTKARHRCGGPSGRMDNRNRVLVRSQTPYLDNREESMDYATIIDRGAARARAIPQPL